MPAVMLPAEDKYPGENRQRNQNKRAGINNDLGNGGTGWNQRPDRILLTDPKCPGQKTWDHDD
jgi:hypothetical protein